MKCASLNDREVKGCIVVRTCVSTFEGCDQGGAFCFAEDHLGVREEGGWYG